MVLFKCQLLQEQVDFIVEGHCSVEEISEI